MISPRTATARRGTRTVTPYVAAEGDTIRIVEMPDLGAVTDASSFVGEHVGSGRFTAPAVRKYTWSGVANVLDFGAIGNGTTDATAAFQAASDSLVNGGKMFVPSGTYLISSPVAIGSNVHVQGVGPGSILTASADWVDPGIYGADPYVFLINKSYGVLPIVVENVKISDLQFTWINQTDPSSHSIRFNCARNITVQDCLFRLGGDAVAFLQCETTRIEGNSAYGCTNCPYDHWAGTASATVINNYFESYQCSQVTNFNGLGNTDIRPGTKTSRRFVCIGNTYVITGPGVSTLNVDSLNAGDGTHNVVESCIIQGNYSKGVIFVARGNVKHVLVQGNTFDSFPAPYGAIQCYADGSDPTGPTNIAILGNTIVSPATVAPSLGVIDVRAGTSPVVISGNRISGGTYSTVAIEVSSNPQAIVVGNYCPAGTGGVAINGSQWTSTDGDLIVKANQFMRARMSGAGTTRLGVDNTDNFVCTGRDVGGGIRNIWSCQQMSTTAPFVVWPQNTTIGAEMANFFRATSSAADTALMFGVNPNSADADVYMQLIGKGARGVVFAGTTKSGTPTNTDLVPGQGGIYKDSGAGTVVLAYNDGGTIKKVTLA